MHRIKRWLRANGFVVLHEGTVPGGRDLTVWSPGGRVLEVVHRPRTDPQPLLETLAGVLEADRTRAE